MLEPPGLSEALGRVEDPKKRKNVVSTELGNCIENRTEKWCEDVVKLIYATLAGSDGIESDATLRRAVELLYDEPRLDLLSTQFNLELAETVKTRVNVMAQGLVRPTVQGVPVGVDQAPVFPSTDYAATPNRKLKHTQSEHNCTILGDLS